MDGIYDVTLRSKVVGQIQVYREGLYYRFRCRCDLAGDVCKLYVTCGEKQVKLGVLVPMGDEFGLDTRLPVKQFGHGQAVFSVVPNRTVLAGKFVPICPEEPFSYIQKLKNAYLVSHDGQNGIVIQEKAGT